MTILPANRYLIQEPSLVKTKEVRYSRYSVKYTEGRWIYEYASSKARYSAIWIMQAAKREREMEI